MNKASLLAVALSLTPLHALADTNSTLKVATEPEVASEEEEVGSVGPPAPGPNLAAALILRSREERLAEHTRRLKIATYALTLTGAAAGSWAIASGVRGHHIDDECAGAGSCSAATAAQGRMLYRSANAGAAIAAVCGVSAAIVLWRLLTVSSSDDWRSATTWPFTF